MLLNGVAYSDTTQIKVRVGGNNLTIKSPSGFHEISNLSPSTRKLLEKFVPESNRLLAVLVSEEDLGRILKDESVKLERYLLLETLKEDEDIDISPDFFRKFSKKIEENHTTLFNKYIAETDHALDVASIAISGYLGIDIKMGLKEQIPLGIYVNTNNSIGFASLANTETHSEAGKLNEVIVGGTNSIYVKNRLLFGYVYSTFNYQSDIDWVREKSKEWVKVILETNPNLKSVENKPKSKTNIEQDEYVGRGFGLISIFLLIGFISLIVLIFRIMSRLFRKK